MSDSSHRSFRDADIEAQAAGWVMRRDRGLTPGEQDEYLRWLADDPSHGEYFARHQQVWRRLDQLVEWRPEHSPQPNPDLLAPPRMRRSAVLLPLFLAAAAMVAWALVAVWPRIRGSREEMAVKSPAIAQNNARPAAQDGPVKAQDYEEQFLSDGSIIELNRGARVDEKFTPGERDVLLVRGEAHFAVAKNPRRPFVVTAGGVGVRAVGTAFDVNLSGSEVEILVTEGKVQVVAASARGTPDRPSSSFPIAAGQKAIFSSAPHAPPPRIAAASAGQMKRFLAWRPDLLTFTNTPLSEIAAEFNRYNRVQLSVADPEIGALQFTLPSFRSDNVDGFVRLLKARFGLSADTAGDAITLRRAR